MMISTIWQNSKKKIKKAGIIVFWLLVWQFVALAVNNRIMLVGPVDVLKSLLTNIVMKDFWQNVFSSALRIGGGFLAAFFLGLILAFVSYRFSLVEDILSPVVSVIKSVPVVSFVVLLLIWFGSLNLSFFIVTLIVFPNIYINCLAGLKETDQALIEMANLFELTPMRKNIYIYRDAIRGRLLSSVKVALGLSFKSGVAAEVIGLPEFSIGTRIYMSKIYLDTADLFSWTVVVLLVSLIFEKIIIFVLKWAFEYKPGAVFASKHKDISESRIEDIVINDINVTYDEKEVLKNVNVNLKAGGIYCIMGPSGQGKTTLLNEIVKRFEGKASVMYQEDRLLLRYDVITNVAMGNKYATEEECVYLCRKILPDECLRQPVAELSGGMKRRVAYLRALIRKSQLLILDEPFTGLDEEAKDRCIGLLKEVRGGRTVIMVTHDESENVKVGGNRLWIQELH